MSSDRVTESNQSELCGRSYLDHLQQAGRLTREFRNRFRRREPWSVTVNYRMFDDEQDIE